MDSPAPVNKAKLKRKAFRLIKAAEEVLMQGAAQAAGFSDPEDFRRALVAALALSPAFEAAARDFHAPLKDGTAPGPWQRLGKAPKPGLARLKTDGRVQAPRHDPSTGQKDRQRGFRLKGGRVRLGQKRASREPGKSGRRK